MYYQAYSLIYQDRSEFYETFMDILDRIIKCTLQDKDYDTCLKFYRIQIMNLNAEKSVAYEKQVVDRNLQIAYTVLEGFTSEHKKLSYWEDIIEILENNPGMVDKYIYT